MPLLLQSILKKRLTLCSFLPSLPFSPKMAPLVALGFLLLLCLPCGSFGAEVLRPPNGTGDLVRVVSFHHTTGRFKPYGVAYRAVFQMFQNYVHRIGGIFLWNPYVSRRQVEFTLIDIGANTWEQMKANVEREVSQVRSGAYGNFTFAIAPYSSELTPLVAEGIQNMPVLAPGAAASSVFLCDDAVIGAGKCFNQTSRRRFRNLFGTLAPAAHYPDLAMQLARFRRARIALLLENT
eukprot:RCo016275